jgi:hypothetical protein
VSVPAKGNHLPLLVLHAEKTDFRGDLSLQFHRRGARRGGFPNFQQVPMAIRAGQPANRIVARAPSRMAEMLPLKNCRRDGALGRRATAAADLIPQRGLGRVALRENHLSGPYLSGSVWSSPLPIPAGADVDLPVSFVGADATNKKGTTGPPQPR